MMLVRPQGLISSQRRRYARSPQAEGEHA